MKVVVVEDCAPVCERLVELIESSGQYRVIGQAGTVREAVSGIAATQPDVGIFDIKLKCGSGIDALAKAKRQLPQLVGIVLSNHVTEQHRGASADAGAAFFLDKSADFETSSAFSSGCPAILYKGHCHDHGRTRTSCPEVWFSPCHSAAGGAHRDPAAGDAVRGDGCGVVLEVLLDGRLPAARPQRRRRGPPGRAHAAQAQDRARLYAVPYG